jgi:6-phosphogluconolactonase
VGLIRTIPFTRFALPLFAACLLASCGGSDDNGPNPVPKVAVPNVVGLTQTAATSAITAAGLTVGTVTMASSATVASGSVVSQTPAAATMVASASVVNLTVSSGLAQVAVPNVVGMTQTAATSAITAAGLTVGTVTMATSATVPSGSVISQSPAAATMVATASAVNLTVSSGATQVAVPNVVGATQAAATTAITGAGLTVGTVTGASSATVASGSVISQSPAAATMVASGSAVNLTVSTGPATSFAYVTNAGDGTISAYSINSSTGALTALASSPIAVPGGGTYSLAELKVDPSGKFLYVTNTNLVNNVLTSDVYAYAISASDGSLTAVAGSPFPAGVGSFSLTFDASGTHLYTANAFDNNGVGQGTISAYSLNTSTGVLTPLANSPYTIAGTNTQPTQIVRAGNFLYVTDQNNNSVEAFAIASGTGALTQNVPGSPFATDVGPFSLAVDPSGSVLYTNNGGAIPPGQFSGPGSISAFTVNSTTGALTPVAGNPLPLSAANGITIDPSGKFLLLTESSFSPVVNGVSVYPINKTTGVLGTLVAGSPFATGGTNAFSVSIDPTGQFVYVGNDQSANVSEFTLNSTTGVLTPVAGSPVAAGNSPDYIATN